jgi:hypothetical protein
MLTDKEAAALERLEAEKERRISEKIEKGEAVRMPVLVVGTPEDIDTVRAATLAALRAAGEKREVVPSVGNEIGVIITGVPRAGRDNNYTPPNVSEPPTPSIFDRRSAPREPQAPVVDDVTEKTPATHDAPVERAENPMRCVRTQVERPSDRNPGGAIVEGLYRVEGDMVEVTDMDGRLLGRAPIKPGDDPEVAARRILREKRAASGFYDPIPYRSVH